MKKNKASGPAPENFNHNPFKSLKGLKPVLKPIASHKAKTSARKEAKEDDAELFMRAVSGVRPIDHSCDDRPQSEKKKNVEPLPERADEQQLFLDAMRKIGARLREDPARESDEAHRQSPSSRVKQLKRGSIRIHEELDLHGHLKEQALAALEQFIAAAYERGRKAVLVITGKGINSSDGPVLQNAVADWLRGKGKGMVAEFAAAPRDKGGSGAFVVFLKAK